MINASTEYLIFYTPSTDEYITVAPGEQLPQLKEEDIPVTTTERRRYVGMVVGWDIKKNTPGSPRPYLKKI